MESKIVKIETLKKSMTDMIHDFEKNFMARDDGNIAFLEFLDDVLQFIRWTGSKYKYRYDGINKRVVKKGEIYYCDLGENIGSEQSERRPVLILQNNTGNKYAPTTIIAPITNSPKSLPVHISLPEVAEGLTTTGVIRLEHIREVAKCRLGIFIEKIDVKSAGWKRVDEGIKRSLDVK